MWITGPAGAYLYDMYRYDYWFEAGGLDWLLRWLFVTFHNLNLVLEKCWNLNYPPFTSIKFLGCLFTRISFCLALETWVYISVVLIELCPSIRCIYLMSTSCSNKRVAKECRNICGVICYTGDLRIPFYHKTNRLVRQFMPKPVYKKIPTALNILPESLPI